MKPLKEYQERLVEYALAHPYQILAADPGLGKTRCAIEISRTSGGKCLVVCPSYLVSNWVAELKLWSPQSKVLAIKAGKDIGFIHKDVDYVVVSYDLAQKAEHFFEWASYVVLDEAHNIKSQKAKRTEFIHRVVYENSIKRVSLLTGTPIRNRVEEFYSLLALCNYDPRSPESEFLVRFPDSITFADHFSFREEYQIEIGRRLVTIVKWAGLRSVKELRGYLKDHYIRIKSSDVLDLPPISYKSLHISDVADPELHAAFMNYFDDPDDESIDRKKNTSRINPTAKAQAALKKAPITVKYAKDLLEEVGCVLIYSDHVEASEEIAKAFNVPALNGNMPTTKRMEYAKRFQDGEGNVLVATIGALSEGVNLTRASHLILNDYPWVPGALKQVIYRIQRIGQANTCTIHKMVGSPQDEYIIDTIQKKLETIEKAT